MSRSVVHLLAPAAYGGLESVVVMLAGEQARRGDDVTVVGTFASSPDGQPFWDRVRGLSGLRSRALVIGGRQYLKERRQVDLLLRELGAEVLHTHGYRSDVLGGPVGRAVGAATVTTVHGFTGNGWKNRAYEWLQRRAYRRFDAVVAVSEKLARDLEEGGVPPGVLHRLPNAWTPQEAPLARSEARARLGLSASGPVVGWVGRMSPEKAPDVALDAFARISDPSAMLCFVGDGPMKRELTERARVRGLGERIVWAGVVPEAGRYLPAFDALLVSSWTEGTPIVLFEAMGAGVPVVTTAVGGIPDVVTSGEAWLVEAGDVEGLAGALGPILAAAPEAERRVARARARLAAEYAVEPWAKRYDEVYESCFRE